MTISFDPMMYVFGILILISTLASIVTVIVALRFNSKRISNLEKHLSKKYIDKRHITSIVDKIESHIIRLEEKVEKLIDSN